MFSSRSVWVHILRGCIGFGCLGLALFQLTHYPLWSIFLLITGIAMLRGCPACWTIGLIETIHKRRVTTCTPCGEKKLLASSNHGNDTSE